MALVLRICLHTFPIIFVCFLLGLAYVDGCSVRALALLLWCFTGYHLSDMELRKRLACFTGYYFMNKDCSAPSSGRLWCFTGQYFRSEAVPILRGARSGCAVAPVSYIFSRNSLPGLSHWMAGWLAICFADWLVGWLLRWLVGWLVGRLAGRPASWPAGWLAGWLVSWLAGS